MANFHPLKVALFTIAATAVCNVVAAGNDPANPALLVDSLHQAFGKHHARAVHSKGVLLEGEFQPDPGARLLSITPLFSSGPTAVIARFSDFTGLPDIPDAAPEANPRGLALKFRLAGNETMDIVTHSFNGFPVATAAEFGELMRAVGASGNGAAKPTPLDRFLAVHPVAKQFLTSQKPAPASYATLSYFGVNAFAFTNASGNVQYVRYRFVPVAGEALLDPKAIGGKAPDYLRDEIAVRVSAAPASFDWFAQVAVAGDAVADPSVPWAESRKLVRLGRITLTRMVADQANMDKTLLFIPGNVTAGIAPADPMIAVRSAAYPISFSERQ